MKTLIELYDKEIIFNISAAAAIKPESIVFICDKKISKKRKAPLMAVLKKYCPGSQVFFYHTDCFDCDCVEKILTEAEQKFADIAVELTGGSGVIAYGAGKYAADKSINAFIYDNKSCEIIYVSGPKKGEREKAALSLDIEDFAVMAGGRYIRHGHFNVNSFSEEIFSDALKVWKIFLKYKSGWHKQAAFFQAVSSGSGIMSSCLRFSVPQSVRKRDGSTARADMRILKELEQAGILSDVNSFSDKITFEFKNPTIKSLLNDFGVWLELFIYKTALDSGKFDNVDMSVVIDWNTRENEPDDVLNEIDVIVTKGTVPVFISCKAGNVSAAALNEIKTLTDRFGGADAKAVLATAEELSANSLKTYRRATELGIKVIELSDLYRENPAAIIERILKNG